MIYLQQDERVLIKSRKHWFVIFRELFSAGIVYIAPFLLFLFVDVFGYLKVEPSAMGVVFLLSFWTLLNWLIIFSIWTNYYLDIWIVTDKRIINIEQFAFFSRQVATQRIERVQDVQIEVKGIFETLLGFGAIRVQTAGQETAFIARGIPRPDRAKQVILERVDSTTPVQE